MLPSPDRWKQIEALFHESLELKTEARSAFLDERCGSDTELREEVEALLEQAAGSLDLLRHQIVEAAQGLAAGAVTLEPGTGMSHYQIVSLLATGGMGQVYLAEDTTLKRKVAIKVLSPAYTRDEAGLLRFEREAQAASALNHPNIVTIYECGQVNDLHFIVSEFVDGSTLRQKLSNGRLELNTVLDIAIQIAGALDVAHAAGIIHRDIKPENVMVRNDGLVKVLDFGIAKLSKAPTLLHTTAARSSMLTQPGMVIGTVAYMSPEHATGKELDSRTDLFSFGVVLYEMSTGSTPFPGESPGAVIDRMLTQPPIPPLQLNPDIPTELEDIISKSLQKERSSRYQQAAEMRFGLQQLKQASDPQMQVPVLAGKPAAGAADLKRVKRDTESKSVTTVGAAVSPVGRKWKLWFGVGALVVLLATIAWGVYSYLTPKPPPFQKTEMAYLTTTGTAEIAAISPDGRYVAYVRGVFWHEAKESLWVRQVAGGDVQIAAPDDVRYDGLTFSPDGDFLYFVRSEGKDTGIRYLYKIPVLGGTSKRLIADVDGKVTFSPDGKQLAFVRHSNAESAVVVASEDGSGEKKVAVRNTPNGFTHVAWSRNGKTIAISTSNFESGSFYDGLVEIPVQGGLEHPLTRKRWLGFWDLAWVSDGHGLIATTQDRIGGPIQIEYISYANGKVRRITNDLSNYRSVSLTADSRILATVQANFSFDLWVAPFPEADRAKPITSGGNSEQGVWSPDGKIVYASGPQGEENIWVMGSDGTDAKPLTTNGGWINVGPSVCGHYIVFVSYRTGSPHIWRMDSDGNNLKELITTALDHSHPGCTPDGKWVVYSEDSPKWGIWKAPLEGGDPVLLSSTKGALYPSVSPDGKMLAYSYRDPSVTPPNGVSITFLDGGMPEKHLGIDAVLLRWAPDGRSLLYIKTEGGISNIWNQPIAGGPPQQITHFNRDMSFGLDVSRDGKQLVMDRNTVNEDVVLIREVK